METMRSNWTDERLDDLNNRVSDGFNRVDAELRLIHTRIDALQRTMLHGFIAMSAAILTAFGGVAGLIATQL